MWIAIGLGLGVGLYVGLGGILLYALCRVAADCDDVTGER